MPPKLELLTRRTVRAHDGNIWHIREVKAHDVPGALSATCLIFEADTVVRRFWRYPERWHCLPDDALVEFAERRRA